MTRLLLVLLAVLLSACQAPAIIVQNHVDEGRAGGRIHGAAARNIDAREKADLLRAKAQRKASLEAVGAKQGGVVSVEYVLKLIDLLDADYTKIRAAIEAERRQLATNWLQAQGFHATVAEWLTGQGVRWQDLRAINDELDK